MIYVFKIYLKRINIIITTFKIKQVGLYIVNERLFISNSPKYLQ